MVPPTLATGPLDIEYKLRGLVPNSFNVWKGLAARRVLAQRAKLSSIGNGDSQQKSRYDHVTDCRDQMFPEVSIGVRGQQYPIVISMSLKNKEMSRRVVFNANMRVRDPALVTTTQTMGLRVVRSKVPPRKRHPVYANEGYVRQSVVARRRDDDPVLTLPQWKAKWQEFVEELDTMLFEAELEHGLGKMTRKDFMDLRESLFLRLDVIRTKNMNLALRYGWDYQFLFDADIGMDTHNDRSAEQLMEDHMREKPQYRRLYGQARALLDRKGYKSCKDCTEEEFAQAYEEMRDLVRGSKEPLSERKRMEENLKLYCEDTFGADYCRAAERWIREQEEDNVTEVGDYSGDSESSSESDFEDAVDRMYEEMEQEMQEENE